jgi:GH24 family phage-related lysozyme (muramidase)
MNLKVWSLILAINITEMGFADKLQTRQIVVKPEEPVKFDPEGAGYDYASAEAAGMKPEIDPTDNKPHWGSVVPTSKEEQEQFGLPEESYMILKGKSHETYDKAVQGEADRGFRIKKFGDRYYSVPGEINTEGKDVEIDNQVRNKLYPGEDKYFKENPNVGGMMTEDNKVIINPYSNLTDNEKQTVIKNEKIRLNFKENNIVPDINITEEQRALFKGTPYENNEDAMKQTIVARIMTGDPSAKATKEQTIVANKLNYENKNVEINNKSVIDSAYDKLLNTEGAEGDKASDVATGKRGLTTKLFNSIKKKYNNEKMTEKEASKIYLQESYDAFSQVEGFNKLTQDEQIAILDNAYNLGYENMLGYKNFMAALKDGTDKDAIFKNLLDTAKVEGKSSKGVAKRRAEAYNVGNPNDPITRVEQTANGIIYYKGDKEYFKFDAPKSEASKVGIIDIVSD